MFRNFGRFFSLSLTLSVQCVNIDLNDNIGRHLDVVDLQVAKREKITIVRVD